MGDHLTIDLALLRATGAGLKRIQDARQHAKATNPGARVPGSGSYTILGPSSGERGMLDGWFEQPVA